MLRFFERRAETAILSQYAPALFCGDSNYQAVAFGKLSQHAPVFSGENRRKADLSQHALVF